MFSGVLPELLMGLSSLLAHKLRSLLTMLGMIFGVPSLRIKGLYLAVATLAAQFFADWMFLRIKWFTNDSTSGTVSVADLSLFGVRIDGPLGKYFFCLGFLLVFALIAKNLVRSHVGRSWMAVRDMDVAAEVIAGELQGNKELAAAAFNARVIPSVAYTDPEVAWVGLTEDQAKAQGIKVKKGLFPWTASGRAIANGRDEGVTKLLFDDSPEAHGHGKILGGGMVGTHAGDMIGEVALAIEMGADAIDIGKTIHPHPTLGESIGMAAEVAHGSCTDLPPSKK